MNYFAHARRFLDDPYFVAGTAIPDWLSVIDRKMRVRSKAARPFGDDPDPRVRSLARGIMQHHHDDRWFHGTRAFAELSLRLTVAIRDVLPRDDGFRPSFVGHVLVELLLDAELIDQAPGALARYYQALQSVAPPAIQQAVNRMASRRSELVMDLISRFCEAQFLYDYADDEKLRQRINAVLRRVQLAPLPTDFLQVVPDARKQISCRREELLEGESSADLALLYPCDEGDRI